ncbi:gamma-glutamyltranspeptidase [Tothia fuscella]|uniref:Glutathione hydrolase n=1 Tax=Tothia fuscella TaxID=1048955 RepID=A0A9P4NPW1_9PEZI|nr:gamma-glutamyltranspeptidase [Tothia fuscella]
MAPIFSLLTSQLALTSPLTYTSSPAKHGAVASESDICSRIGIDIFEVGGNAADSLVATTFCVGVVGMYHSGIGGGGFMVVRRSDGEYENIDFRETAPMAADEDMFLGNVNGSIVSGLASGVPGELRGLQYLHENYGSLPWKALVKPAIKIARFGWAVNADLVRYMESATVSDDFLTNDPNWAIDFAPRGKRLALGETITRKRYADTLEKIAEDGPDVFYEGPMAQAMIDTLQAQNGSMTMADLKNYTVALRKPATINCRGQKLTSCSAPASGIVALTVMNVISGYDNIGDPAVLNLSTHRLDEAMRFGYGMRTELGDPSFVPGMVEYQDSMISEETGEAIRKNISDTTTFPVAYYDPLGIESLDTPGTSHVVTAEASGMAVSLTTTVNLLFGSKVVIPQTGVIMNNEMNDFSIPNTTNAFGYAPSPANFVRAGKRPLSSISPTIAEYANGSLAFIIGAAGGSRITTATIQSLWFVLDRNMSVSEALVQSRLHDQLIPNQAAFEEGYDPSTVEFMASLGHNVTIVPKGASAVQGIRVTGNGTFEAAGEPRQKNSGGFAY